MRPSHHETDPYNQPITLINNFKILSDCFKVISNYSKKL